MRGSAGALCGRVMAMIQAVDAAGHVGEAEFDALIGPHVELALRLAVTMFTCPVAAGGVSVYAMSL